MAAVSVLTTSRSSELTLFPMSSSAWVTLTLHAGVDDAAAEAGRDPSTWRAWNWSKLTDVLVVMDRMVRLSCYLEKLAPPVASSGPNCWRELFVAEFESAGARLGADLEVSAVAAGRLADILCAALSETVSELEAPSSWLVVRCVETDSPRQRELFALVRELYVTASYRGELLAVVPSVMVGLGWHGIRRDDRFIHRVPAPLTAEQVVFCVRLLADSPDLFPDLADFVEVAVSLHPSM